MTEKTTVVVSTEIWQRLNARGEGPGKSFDDVIHDLLTIANGVEESEIEVEEYLNRNSERGE